MQRVLVALVLVCTACSGPVVHIEGDTVKLDLADDAAFFDAPFPHLGRQREDGTVRVRDFPTPQEPGVLIDLLRALDESPAGIGQSPAVYLPFDVALDEQSLPTPAESLSPDSPVQLVNVDAASADWGRRTPVRVSFKAAAETYSAPFVLVVLPEPGFVLAPHTRYAVWLTDGVLTQDGAPLGAPLALQQRKAGALDDDGRFWRGVDDALLLWRREGRDDDALRALTVFDTGDPLAPTRALRDAVRALPPPTPRNLTLLQEHDTFCVIAGEVELSLWQQGRRPYGAVGGDIVTDDHGGPVQTGREWVRFALSVPRAEAVGRPMPATGWPLLLYAAGQGGSYTQFVDRGTFAEQEATPGRGPALYLAHAGIAALSIEAPLVGPRHPSGDDSGLQFFDPSNPVAFRDNPRQAAADFFTLARLPPGLSVPHALCPGSAGPHTFDPDQVLFWGHSTGATVGGLVLGLEDDIAAGMLSGVGGGWFYNLTIKEQPLDFGALVKVILEYDEGDDVDLFDPAVQFAQMLWEPIEPMNAARAFSRVDDQGRVHDVLVQQGVIDGYFLPPAVNALAVAGDLTRVGPAQEQSLDEALALNRAARATLPAGVAAIQQFVPPGDVDGHHVPFENPEAKHAWRCFFETRVATGRAAALAAPAPDGLAPCPALE